VGQRPRLAPACPAWRIRRGLGSRAREAEPEEQRDSTVLATSDDVGITGEMQIRKNRLVALGLHWGQNGLTFAASGAGLYGLSRLLPGDPIRLVIGGDSFTAGPWAILAVGGAFALAKLGGRR